MLKFYKRKSVFKHTSKEINNQLKLFLSSSPSPSSKVRSSHKFNETALHDYLIQNNIISSSTSDNSNEFTIQQFSHGQSNPTFIITTGTEKLVMRKQPPGKLLIGAHAVDREYRVMTALKQHSNVPVPETKIFCSNPDIIGTPFFVYNYVEGRFFKDPMLKKITTSTSRNNIYKSMLDTLAKIHSVNIDQSNLSDYGVRYTNNNTNNNPIKTTGQSDNKTKTISPYVLRQIKTWSKAYRATETETIVPMDQLITHLTDLLPSYAEAHTCLVHGDYRLDNVILADKSDDVAAVLDWELSTLGDPLSDVAYWSLPFFLGKYLK